MQGACEGAPEARAQLSRLEMGVIDWVMTKWEVVKRKGREEEEEEEAEE